MMASRTFVKITNENIFQEIKDNKKQFLDEIKAIKDVLSDVKTIKQEVTFHRRFLWSLTGAFGTGFLFIITIFLKSN